MADVAPSLELPQVQAIAGSGTMQRSSSSIVERDGFPERVLLVSRHDYRTAWRANFHPLADAFRALGADVSFLSTGFSGLSRLNKDRRLPLAGRANRWEQVNGIHCFLWRSPFHPIRMQNALLDRLMTPLFKLWAALPCRALDDAAAAADLILVESDLSAVLLARLRRAAPAARIVYLASDLLETIGAAPQIGRELQAARAAIDHVVVVSRGMAPALAKLGRPLSYVPHGIDPDDFGAPSVSPYPQDGRPRIVSVGSMLFDRSAVEAIATAFPDVELHLIGAPPGADYPPNVVQHGTMPFRQTVPWLRHADIGLAPYRPSPASDYLADSSMKLMQFAYLGLPALCPAFAVGDHPSRFGYTPGDAASIAAATTAALAEGGQGRSLPVQTWQDAALRIAALPAA